MKLCIVPSDRPIIRKDFPVVDVPPRPWAEREVIAFDTETSGVDVESDRIVSAVIAHIRPGEPPVVHKWLINPGVEIPAAVVDIHGLTNEHVREHGREPAGALAEIRAVLAELWTPEVPLIGHNPPFDLSIVDREFARHLGGAVEIHGPVIDTLTIDRHVWQYLRGKGMRKLQPACERYGVPFTGAHDAEEDALASARLAWAISRRYPGVVGNVPPSVLHERQPGWHRAWALNYASSLVKQVRALARAVEFGHPQAAVKILEDGVEPTEENIVARGLELEGRMADLRRTAGQWPLRPRPVS